MGRRNAAVFPLPVIAQARTSRPASAGGMASLWTVVGRVKPSSRVARRRAGSRPRPEKGMRSLRALAPRTAGAPTAPRAPRPRRGAHRQRNVPVRAVIEVGEHDARERRADPLLDVAEPLLRWRHEGDDVAGGAGAAGAAPPVDA